VLRVEGEFDLALAEVNQVDLDIDQITPWPQIVHLRQSL
jgi:hypothetical protein